MRASGDWGELIVRLPALLERLERRGQPQRVRSLCDWGLEALAALPASDTNDKMRLHLLELLRASAAAVADL